MKTMKKLPPIGMMAVIGSVVATLLVALTHRTSSIISFDEGFHGGAALYLHQFIIAAIHHHDPYHSLKYLFGEFANGVTLYPALWALIAACLSLIFGPTIGVFRATTSLFYCISLIFTYFFVTKATKQPITGALATLFLATVPMVVIYSHLMMLEVPLLLGITLMVGSFYLATNDLIPRNWITFLLITAVFALGPLTKLPALPITWVIILVYALLATILFYRQRFFRHFLKPEILVWLGVSIASLLINIKVIKYVYSVDMLGFFIGQSANQSQHIQAGNPLVRILTLAWTNRDFYTRDFKHMPLLSFIWVGSLLASFLWKRSPFTLLLLCWAIITYAAFSGVEPQVPQYLMPIYVPLAIAPALIITEVFKQKSHGATRWGPILGTSLLLVGLQLYDLPKSEGYGWRSEQTGYEQAAQTLANQAKHGDRVVAWYDGAILAVRQKGLDKQLQIMHGGPEVCPEGLKDSTDWAIVTNNPPFASDVEKAILSQEPWQLIGSYGHDQATLLYHNTRSIQWPNRFEVESFSPTETITDNDASENKALRLTGSMAQPSYWGCLRLMPFGKSRADFVMKLVHLDPSVSDTDVVIRQEFTGYPGGEHTLHEVTARELRQSHGYAAFPMEIEHVSPDLRSEFRLYIYKPAEIRFDKIVITPKS